MTLDDIALTFIPGLGVKGIAHLLELFGSAGEIFAASEERLVHDALLRPEIARNIVMRKGDAAAERELRRCRQHGIRPIASTDPEYPALLREIPDFPHLLYVMGSVEALSLRCISMVGTRRISVYGQRLCNDLVEGLAAVPRLAVVSGMAFGADIACHRAALAAGIPTIGVLANALPEITPAQHTAIAREILDRGGAMITELSSQSKQKGTFYLPRNRIIAAISAGTVVIESPAAGGSLITAQLADGYNRTVMAPPGRTTDANSFGTNALIRNRKAVLIRTANDIIEELQWEFNLSPEEAVPESTTSDLTPDERKLLALITDEPRTADELIHAGGYDFNTLSTLLIGLELAGFIRQTARKPVRTAQMQPRYPQDMELIDTHSHIYEPEFDEDREAAVARAIENGVSTMLLPAIDPASDERMFALCRRHPECCLPMMGLHPTSVNDNPTWRSDLQRVEGFLIRPPQGISRFYGVGEIGLDFYWSDRFVEEQTEAFVRQLRLAARFDLPAVIHTRAAWSRMAEIIETETARARAGGYRLRGIFHAFSEDLQMYERLRSCGEFLFGIGGVVTFRKSRLADTVREMALDDLVLETDCPYLTPAPHRGERNEPAYLRFVCQKIAEVKGLPAGEVASATTANARRLFLGGGERRMQTGSAGFSGSLRGNASRTRKGKAMKPDFGKQYDFPEILLILHGIYATTFRHMESSVLIIYTGGTIGMKTDPSTGTLVPFDFNGIYDEFPSLRSLKVHIDVVSLDPIIDSSNVTPALWQHLAELIRDNYARYDGFVILHGTDTMSYTASALSFLLENLSKAVVFTGSQIPIGVLRTDGRENLITAIEIAAARDGEGSRVPEVSLYFQNRLFRANRTKKQSAEEFAAFRSYNYPALAEVGVNITYHREYIHRPARFDADLQIAGRLDDRVLVVKLFPGLHEEMLHAMLSIEGLRGVVLETYGAGNAPTAPAFIRTVRNAVDRGVVVMNVTQCTGGKVAMELYETGRQLQEAGVICGYDITTEAAVAKLMYILGQNLPPDPTLRLLRHPLRGEFTSGDVA